MLVQLFSRSCDAVSHFCGVAVAACGFDDSRACCLSSSTVVPMQVLALHACSYCWSRGQVFLCCCCAAVEMTRVNSSPAFIRKHWGYC